MHITFRADASLQIGTGHVMRCLTLADALRERGAICSFVCRPHQGHLMALINQRGYRVLALPKLLEGSELNPNGTAHAHWLCTDWTTDAQDTQQALAADTGDQPVDWLVVDHYALDARWEKTLRPQAKCIMVIDDLADRPHVCDLLLDQNLGRKDEDYIGLLNGKPVTLIGPQYALLRPEFAAMRAQSLERRQSPHLRRLLITMGGVDKDNATGQVLAALQSCNLPADLSLTVVMGLHAPWLVQVRAQATQMPWYTEVLVGVDNMAQLMAECDLAIGASGSTSWERCCLGVPTIQIALTQNQVAIGQALSNSGAALAVKGNAIAQTLPNLVRTVANADKLSAISLASSSITQGKGTLLVSDFMKRVYENHNIVQ
ncbi:UDP-2,4-diacetamido-2,4,6-trideoxy-beta-L-altropyranose hydrolase [Polynucleobacter acidiphobus]|uniref:UDP-2,4-diacetamido-2,4, 6-trideoxy-beta-L-altropyranose hydrolase n=1 Tax=Polynucleobacter acidiphobus TaxID=556053 RepID=UPI000D33E824|nr:UDP-2,4-diacetamido-2,4,6-trideoxy-beta-L-altropyranose hydrolase [Polynucleobacter acidiphobus]